MSKKDLKVGVTSGGLLQPVKDLTNAFSTTYASYVKNLTPRLKLIDIFLGFLVLLGVLQFVYVILIGNFPFNAFLGGFISCVGQFVLTTSLRLQYVNQNKTSGSEVANDETEIIEGEEASAEASQGSKLSNFENISPERALGDYIFASLILHFTVFHFIN